MSDAPTVIRTKRDGGRLADAEIDWVIDAYTRGDVGDEQMAALLMAIFLRGMAGSRIPVVVAHGEGRVVFDSPAAARKATPCLRYVDNSGRPTERFPLNPNGSADGAAGYSAADGRITILMPHPERVFRTSQMSWHPREWGEASPWLRLFRNAREWVN